MPQVDLSSPDGRAKLSTLALPLISQVPGEALRLYLRQQLGNKLGLLDDSQLDKLMPKQIDNANTYQPPQLKRTTMRILIGLLVQNPQLATLIPSLQGLEQAKLAGLPLFIELVETCLAQPGLTTGQLLELYRDNKFSQQLETLATWNHMIVEDMVEPTFVDTLASLYDSILEQRQETLIARDRTHGLNAEERKELWSLNLALARKNETPNGLIADKCGGNSPQYAAIAGSGDKKAPNVIVGGFADRHQPKYSEVWIPSYGAKPAVTAEATCHPR